VSPGGVHTADETPRKLHPAHGWRELAPPMLSFCIACSARGVAQGCSSARSVACEIFWSA
jgi:hypothetical protein